MSAREIVQAYFEELKQRGRWEAFLADDLTFTSLTTSPKGARACALTRYQLQAPSGSRFQSDVAELFTVRNGKIAAFAIYFDTAPFPK